MDKIKVSVIVPVYNVEKYIDKCLTSISNQTLKEIEIIVINDGSTDNTLELLLRKEKEDSRIKIINQSNKGLAKTRNIGLKYSKGKYIIHIDGDDWIENNYLEDMFKFAEKNNLDMVVTDYWEELLEINKKIYRKIDISPEIINSSRFRELFYQRKINNSLWNKMIKREIIFKNGIYSLENVTIGEDLAVIIRLMYFLNKIGKINKAYYHYNRHSLSMTKQKKAKFLYSYLNIFDVLEVELIKLKKVIKL